MGTEPNSFSSHVFCGPDGLAKVVVVIMAIHPQAQTNVDGGGLRQKAAGAPRRRRRSFLGDASIPFIGWETPAYRARPNSVNKLAELDRLMFFSAPPNLARAANSGLVSPASNRACDG